MFKVEVWEELGNIQVLGQEVSTVVIGFQLFGVGFHNGFSGKWYNCNAGWLRRFS